MFENIIKFKFDPYASFEYLEFICDIIFYSDLLDIMLQSSPEDFSLKNISPGESGIHDNFLLQNGMQTCVAFFGHFLSLLVVISLSNFRRTFFNSVYWI